MPEDLIFLGIDPNKLTPEQRGEFISMVKTLFDEDFPENKEEENQWQK